jgi:DNA-binding transcriptional ArsR family regulator
MKDCTTETYTDASGIEDFDLPSVRQEPFALVPEWVFERLLDDPHALRFYTFMALRVIDGSSRQGHRTVDWIAEQFKTTSRTVKRWLAVCVETGVVLVKRTRRRDGRLGRNSYWLPRDNPDTVAEFGGAPPRGHPEGTRGHPVSPNHGTRDVPSGIQTQLPIQTQPEVLPRADAHEGKTIIEAEVIEPPPQDHPTHQMINAGTMTAQWIDWCCKRDIKLPPTTIKRYAAKFKELLAAGFEPALIGRALQAMCKDNAISRPHLIDNYLVRIQAGPERNPHEFRTAHEKRQDLRTEADQTLPLAEKLAQQRGVRQSDTVGMLQILNEVKAFLRSGASMAQAYTRWELTS